MIQGYVDDMLCVFTRCRELAKPTSQLVFIVGNSRHGGEQDHFDVAADILLARAAELSGWTVREISVARTLKRRGVGSSRLRESVVTLQLDPSSAGPLR